MTDDPDLWEVRTSPGGLVLDLCGGACVTGRPTAMVALTVAVE